MASEEIARWPPPPLCVTPRLASSVPSGLTLRSSARIARTIAAFRRALYASVLRSALVLHVATLVLVRRVDARTLD